ncbi:hypothetical protein G9A89_019928 [Geosiphon pyriformis]|nr:hypothetical protein G9A89_019928 [Geosiphon pyriformis]
MFTTTKNNFKVVTTSDATTLEYYQSIYTHCKQKFNIPDEIEVVKKSVYQYIENRINNYLFGNYNILEVKSNLYNNLVHYLQLRTEDLNSETLATYFQELNFNIIKYCEETYPVQSQYSIDFELETETSNKSKQKLKQYSKTTPNTPILPKTTAKHLQIPEQGTSSKLLLTITPFSASFTQAQTPNSPLNRFTRLKNFTLPRTENQSEHSKAAANEKNDSEISEKESIDSKNKEDKMTAYITKIPEFNREDIETSLQEWLNQVTKAGDANRWNATRIYLTIPEEQNFHHTALSEDRAAARQQNPSYTSTTILPARIAKNANLSDIFPFEFKANESLFLLSNAAANEQKAITTMYTKAEVERKTTHLILDSGSARSIITYQLMQQLKRNVNQPAQTVIVTADGIKKTPVGEIDNFPFTLDGITIPVKVLVMDASQQYAQVPATCGTFNKRSKKAPAFEFKPEEEKQIIKTFMALGSTSNWADETKQEHFTPHSEPKTPEWNIPYSKTEPRKQHSYILLKYKNCHKKLLSIGACISPEEEYKKAENEMEHPVLLVESSFPMNVTGLMLHLEEKSTIKFVNMLFLLWKNKLYHYPHDAKIIYELAMILINRGTKEDVLQIKEAEYIEYTLELAGFDYEDEVEVYHQIASHTYSTQEAQIQ